MTTKEKLMDLLRLAANPEVVRLMGKYNSVACVSCIHHVSGATIEENGYVRIACDVGLATEWSFKYGLTVPKDARLCPRFIPDK